MRRLTSLPLSQKGLILVLVPLTAGTLFTLLVYIGLEHAEREIEEEARLREASQVSELIIKNLFDAAQALGAYGLTRNPALGTRYIDLRSRTPRLYQECRALLHNQPSALLTIDKVELIQGRALKIMDMGKSQIDEGSTNLVHLRYLREQFQSLLEQAMEEAQSLSEKLRTDRKGKSASLRMAKNQLRVVLGCGLIGNFLLSFLLSSFFTREIGKRLLLITDNATRLTERKELNPILEGTDEIAELDKVFHWMAGALADLTRKERAIVDNAADVICSLDRQGNFQSVSPASLRVWGYQPEELLNGPLQRILAEDDVRTTLDFLAKAFDREGELLFENRIVRANGELIDVYWSMYCSANEEILFCIAHDITLRKQAETLLKESEERITLTMASVPIGLFVINANGLIEFANKTFEIMLKLQDRNLAGINVASLFSSSGAIDSQTLEQSTGKSFETNMCKTTGEVFPSEVTVSSFMVRGERKLLVACLDITERQEIEQAKREFVAMVSHDLRTPLTSLQGTIYLLEIGSLGSLNDRGKLIMKKMEKELGRLIRLINDLLDFEKLKAGKFDLAFHETKISEVIEASIDAVRHIADVRQIQITVDSVDWKLECDGARIIQVLVNLLSNALKFSPTGGTVEVCLTRYDDGIEVGVRDRGRGIPEEFRTAIFEKFKQVKREDATHHKGTGLGLPICKAIIEQHAGTIGVESVEGEGSTFWFRLPETQASQDHFES